ncbi:MAG: UDP-3-O-(3-hydroxymyristoyl)glucosamine N-acyltransferase [Gammaproteobacteria bacterium]|tara:strand:- start:4814 stop:5710 length:897 start_codon:yes stop_codon:yes gene_type:complete
MPTLSLRDIASSIDGEAKGNIDLIISNFSEVHKCMNEQICFIKDESFISKIPEDAGAVILSSEIAKKVKIENLIIVDDPYLAYAKASKLFFDLSQSYEKTDPKIGKNFIKGKNVSIGQNCEIGKNVKIHDNVSLYPNTKIGDDVEIHSGSVIGSDGFGFAKDKNLDKWIKIYQLGSTIIGNDVEIGANCTIDRGALGNTYLANGVKLDNQIHIAHNVVIGKNTAIAAQTAIAGSVKIGNNCQIAGHVSIVGHIKICDNVVILAKSFVTKSLSKPAVYSGVLKVQEHTKTLKLIAKLNR